MKKLKNAIIRWLGGNTDEDLAWTMGETTGAVFQSVIDHLVQYAEEMHGLSGDQWAKQMYDHLKVMQSIEGTYETENGEIRVTITTTNDNEN